MRRVLIALCTALCVLSASPRVSAQTASQGHQASFSGTDAILVAASYGMFSQLVMEDIDRPQFLRTDAAQKNVDFVFGFYRSVKHDAASAAQIEKLRPVLRGEAQFNRGEAASSFSNLELGVANSLQPQLKQAFLGGALTQQTLFNAANLKQRAYDLQYRKFLASATVLDQISPEIAQARMDLAELPTDADWNLVETKARTLTKLIADGTVSAMKAQLTPVKPSPRAP